MADCRLLLASMLCLGMAAFADEVDDEGTMSDAEFIEYLGLWSDTDEEWLMHVAQQDGEDSPQKEPEEEPETENES